MPSTYSGKRVIKKKGSHKNGSHKKGSHKPSIGIAKKGGGVEKR
jgi:hypothetical protein